MKHALVPFLLAAGLAAQTTFVSPLGHGSVAGNSGNKFPWLADTSVCYRYQQIHGDLPLGPKVVRKLAWRRDSSSAVGLGARTLTCEVLMAPASSATGTFVFASNYGAAPTVVVPAMAINVPALVSTSAPPAFEFAVPFTVPFVAPASGPVLWEVRTTATSTGPSAFLDSVVGATTVGTPTALGTGCTVLGANAEMNLVMLQADALGTYELSWYVSDAPTFAATFLAFGLSDPDLPVPGLCSNLRTDLVATLAIGVTDANGFLGLTWAQGGGIGRSGGGNQALVMPNTFPNAVLYAQAHALGAASGGTLPLVNSQGRRIMVPSVNTGAFYGVSRFCSYESATAPFATMGPYHVGAGLVTEFTY